METTTTWTVRVAPPLLRAWEREFNTETEAFKFAGTERSGRWGPGTRVEVWRVERTLLSR